MVMTSRRLWSSHVRRGATVLALSLVSVVCAPVVPAAVADPSAPTLRITPTAFDFGDVPIGTSEQRVVSVTNPSGSPVTLSLAGGGAGPFGGVQNCQGRTLAAGESCQITYTFSATALGEVTGSTSGTVNGQFFSFSFVGNGVPAFRLSTTAIDFGPVAVGSSRDAPISVTNITTTPLTLSLAGGGASEFGGVQDCQGRTLAPAESCTITYTFSPDRTGEATGSTNGTINGQPFTFGLRGVGVRQFALSTNALDFGPVAVGSSRDQSITVTNVGAAPATLSLAGGGSSEFGGVQNCQGRTLASGDSCTITYTFSPSTTGEAIGATNGTINGQPFAFTFRGLGVRQFALSATALDFGPVPVGGSQDESITVTNAGSAPVTVSLAGGGSSEFGGVQNCQGRTLASGQSCSITYTFSPDAPGEATGSTGGTINGQPFAFAFRGLGTTPDDGSTETFRISPTTFDFGDVGVGTSDDRVATVTNAGSAPATVSVSGGGSATFGGVQNCQGRTLAPGESCTITYTFRPTALGEVTGSTGGTINGQPFSFRFIGNGSPSFALSGTSFDFGDVGVGTSENRVVQVTNVARAPVTASLSGGGAAWFGGVQDCQGRTLAPAESCTITYTFSPTALGEVTGSTGGGISGQPFAFTFAGTGAPSFALFGPALDFGPVAVGSSLDQPIRVVNVARGPVTVSLAGGGSALFGGVQNCQGRTLAPGDECAITYTFSPTAVGAVTGSTAGTVAGQPFAFAFQGLGIRQFDLSATALSFGPVPVGSSLDQPIRVTNVGTAPATVSLTGGGAGLFGGVQNCQGRTLAPGGSCEITYTFSPTAPGQVTGSTGGTVNGQPFAFTFDGFGIAADTTPPVVTAVLDPAAPDGAAGWYRGDVRVSFDVDDPESVVTTQGCAETTVAQDTDVNGVTLTCTATSDGGSTTESVTVRRDGAAPAISGGADRDPASTGWYNAHTGPPVVSFTCADPKPGSGVADCTGPTTLDSAATSQHVDGTADDVAGNSTSTTVGPLLVDLVAPTVTCPTSPRFLLRGAGTVEAQVTDEHSGVTDAVVATSADTSTAGRKTAVLTATDVAGNATTVECAYLVGVNFLGFDRPTPDQQVKAGARLPVHFRLGDDSGTPLSDSEALALVGACAVTIGFTAGTPSPNCVRYDALDDRFVFPLDTPKGAIGRHTLTIGVVMDSEVVTTASTTVVLR